MGSQVTYEDAMNWLEKMHDKVEFLEEQEIVEYIQEMLWRYEDMRNS
jgi:hypothetical protein